MTPPHTLRVRPLTAQSLLPSRPTEGGAGAKTVIFLNSLNTVGQVILPNHSAGRPSIFSLGRAQLTLYFLMLPEYSHGSLLRPLHVTSPLRSQRSGRMSCIITLAHVIRVRPFVLAVPLKVPVPNGAWCDASFLIVLFGTFIYLFYRTPLRNPGPGPPDPPPGPPTSSEQSGTPLKEKARRGPGPISSSGAKKGKKIW